MLIFFIAIRNTSIIQGSINAWLDYYIKFRMDVATDTQIAAQKITFLDFDNKSFQILGKPDMTPRDKIAELLSIAYGGNADIVLLDFDFSEPDYSPSKMFVGENVAKSGAERDFELFTLIERIKNDSAAQTKVLVPLATYADRTLKNNIFSSLVDNKKIFAVTPTLTVNRSGDNAARFWLPYLEVKSSEPEILWSIPLLSAVLDSGNFEQLQKLQNEILNTDKMSFDVEISPTEQFKFYREQTSSGGLIRNSAASQYNRIQYVAIPPNVLNSSPFGTIKPSNIGHWRIGGSDNKRIDCQDKIVVIGRADEDCADFFQTPCGILPGMYVHGNSIASILGATRPHLAPLYKYVLLELLLIVVTAYAFLGLSKSKASCVVIALKGLCWIFTYIYFCHTNEFVYLSFCFLFLGVYNFVNNIQQAFVIGRLSLNRFFRRR